MEYLTLQDIPHRYCEPLHSRRMTSTHSAERPLANMVAAVCEDETSPSISSNTSPPLPRRDFTFTLLLPKFVYPSVGLGPEMPGEGSLRLPPTSFIHTPSQLRTTIGVEQGERPSYHLVEPSVPQPKPLPQYRKVHDCYGKRASAPPVHHADIPAETSSAQFPATPTWRSRIS